MKPDIYILGDFDDVLDIRWLPPGTNKDYYVECRRDLESKGLQPVTNSRFNQLWTEFFPSFRIRSGKRASTCKTCGDFKVKLASERDPAKRRQLEDERRDHWEHIREERHRYYFRQKLAMEYPHLYLSIIIDGMDQSTCELPNTGDGQHIHKLGVKVTGAIVHNSPQPRRVHLSYTQAGNTNLYCQVLCDTLLDICDGDVSKLPPILFVQLDNTSSTNKNNLEMRFASYLVERGIHSQVFNIVF